MDVPFPGVVAREGLSTIALYRCNTCLYMTPLSRLLRSRRSSMSFTSSSRTCTLLPTVSLVTGDCCCCWCTPRRLSNNRGYIKATFLVCAIVYFCSRGRMINPAKGASKDDRNPPIWLFPRSKMRRLLAVDTPLRANSRNLVFTYSDIAAAPESRERSYSTCCRHTRLTPKGDRCRHWQWWLSSISCSCTFQRLNTECVSLQELGHPVNEESRRMRCLYIPSVGTRIEGRRSERCMCAGA